MMRIQALVFDASKPYTVEYHPYDREMPAVFEEIKHLINGVCLTVAIEHIGSSSVPGMGGRNVIDIAVPVDSESQTEVRERLYKLGFEDSPFPHYLPLLVGQLGHGGKQYPLLVYVVSPESKVLDGWKSFRDYLRSHPEAAQKYDAIKREAISQGKDLGNDYQEAKNAFIANISKMLGTPVSS